MADIDIKLLKELDEGIKRADTSLQNFSKTLSTLGTQYNKAFANSTVLAGGLRKELDALSAEIKGKSSDIAKAVNKVTQDFATAATLEGKALSDKVINANDFRKSAENALNAVLSVISNRKGQTQQLLQQSIAGISGLDINILPTAMRRKILQRQAQVERESFELRTNPDFSKLNLNKAQYDAMVAALGNYKKAIDQLTDAQNKANTAFQRYNDIANKLKEVPKGYDNVIIEIDKIKQKFSDLQVMKIAGILDEKEFQRVSQVILNQYDELIKKKKAFELTDIDRASNKRKKDQADALRLQQRNYEAIKKKEDELADIQRQRSIREKKYAKELTPDIKQKLKDVYDAEELRIKSLQKEIRQLAKERRDAAKISGVSNSSAAAGGTGDQASTKRELESKKRLLNATRQLEEAEARAAEKRHRQALQASRDFNTITSTVKKLAAALGLTASLQGIANFGRKLIEVRGEFELQQVALRSILQNKQLADEIWDKTMQAALQSPFTAMQLTKYTKQLAAYRIETDKLFDTTKRLADVSAGLGVDMGRLILAYGQVKAANYLRASEIRQFTEAGVNILGELSTYLSSTRGELISTAQVMDMVQKRMVTFADVEAIFKRMTDAGGIFYNMQYVQSQTVKGQINKLHDAYDQMLNSIGKANTGALRDMVSLLLNIVQNWREWKTVLDSIAIPALTIAVIKFAKGLFTTGASARIASKEIHGLALAGTKARLSLAALKRTMVGFKLGGAWGAVGITAAIVAITALVNRYKAVKAINDEIDEHNVRLYETKLKLEDYQTTIERNNASLKDSVGTESSLAEKRKQNSEILAKLKSDYPQLVEGIEQQKNGVINLTDAIKKENEELEKQITLNSLMKSTNMFDDNFTDDAEDLAKAYIKQQQAIIDARANAVKQLIQLEQSGQKGSDVYNILKQISEIDPENIQNASNELIRLSSALRNLLGISGDYSDVALLNDKKIKSIVQYYNKYLNNFTPAIIAEKNATEEFEKLGNTIGYYLAKGLEESYGDEIQKSGLSTMQWYAINVAKVQKDVDNGVKDVYRFLRDALVKNGQAEGPGMKEFWNGLVKKNYVDPYFNAWKQGMDEAEAGGWRFPMPLPTEGNTPNVFAQKTKDSENPFLDDNKNKKGKKSAEQLISLIREMRAEYDKLSKSAYGYAKSEDTVRKSYEKAVEKILGKAGVTKDYDFTTNEGMIAALEKVKAYADKLGPEAAAEVEKYIGQLKSEIELNVQVKVRDDFNRDLEKMFSNYELTLELQGLNIPEGMAKDLFPDLDYTTLGEIQDRMRKFYEEQRNANGEVLFDKDDLEQYRKWADKVDAEILKSRKEKAKQYSKYLEKEYSDRAKLEMQHAKDVAFVTANVSDETQRKNIITQIDKKYQDDLNELHWKSFKESSFYVEMMDDISSLPKEYMQMMLDKIEEILQHPETLSPRALKEAINARQKVLEAQMNLEPLEVMKVSLKSMRAAMASEEVGAKTWKQTKENLNEQITLQGEKIAKYDKEINDLRILQGELKGYEEILEELGNADKKIHIPTLNTLLGLDGEQKLSDITDLDDKRIQDAVDLLTQKLNEAKGQYDATVKTDEMNARAVEISDTERMIALLNDELKARQKLDAYKMSKKAQSAAATGQTSTSVGAQITEKQDEQDKVQERQTTLKDWLRSFKNFDDAFAKFNAAINSTLSSVQNMGNAFYDMFDALGGETNALTEGWKEFGNTMISTITQTLTTIPMMVAAFTAAGIAINSALGIIGLIAEGLQLLFVAIGAIAKLHDAHYEREIEIQQKKIDDLKDAYARLERQIEQTFTTSSYMREFNEQIENLREQMAALEAQRSAESSKKNADADRVREYTNAIIEAQDEIDELGQRQIEVFGGIGKDNYRSWAEGFVDAWKDAFLETGDGLDALQDHFDEFLQEWFVKQATMRIAGKALEGVMGDIDKVVSDNGVVDWAELQRIKDQMDLILPDLNDKLTAFAGMWDFGGDGSLSGLAAGIQGMNEEQANILEAYWNSVRMYTASIDGNVSRIAEMLGANGPNSNPMLTQLQAIAANTNYIPQIYNLLMNTRRNNGNGQGFLTYSM